MSASLIPLFLIVACNKNDHNNESQQNNEKYKSVVEVEDPDNILQGPIVSIGSQTVNISSKGKNKGLLKIKTSIQFEDLYIPENIEVIKIQLIDIIISVISRSSINILSTYEGKNQLKLEILKDINSKLETDNANGNKIKNIYFEEFTVNYL